MIEIKPGDIFLSRNPMALGKVINFVQKIQSQDKKSVYPHAGIVLDEEGTTLEALWTVKSQNLFKDYKGDQVLIVRWDKMDPERFKSGFEKIKPHIGQVYPFLRMIMMAVPPLVRYVTPGWRLVCSEIAAKFLNGAGEDIQWEGVNPDDLHDIFRHWAGYTIIFEGKIE